MGCRYLGSARARGERIVDDLAALQGLNASGAVYGCSTKRLYGCTPLENLHLIGTDQGLLGVTGAMLSGISIANRYALQTASN